MPTCLVRGKLLEHEFAFFFLDANVACHYEIAFKVMLPYQSIFGVLSKY
jgi:hypothetical protein